MIEAAKIFTGIAVVLAAASLYPRFRLAMKASWACVAVVALCLAGDSL